ncbi:hypothetical protein OG338_12965 [Streptomyces sp. NBC_00726]|uniref:hypothetical protein n=1 Tax=Streptomyces sp. NBC_00726 TaxID=2903674 RepID=UPI0038657727
MATQESTIPPQKSRWKLLTPAVINFLLGIPAVIPLYSAQLLLTTYRACALNTEGYGSDCGDARTIEATGWHRASVVLIGGLGLLLVLAVDVLFPAGTGRPRRRWLAASAALPVPYLLASIAFAIFN